MLSINIGFNINTVISIAHINFYDQYTNKLIAWANHQKVKSN